MPIIRQNICTWGKMGVAQSEEGCGSVGWCVVCLVINAQNDWRDVGRPQVAMRRNCHIFTALHGMQTRSCDEISVRPSVRPSVLPSVRPSNAWIVTKRQKICLDFYIIRKIIHPSFLRKRMIGGGDPFYLKFWVNRSALERNRRFWTDNRS